MNPTPLSAGRNIAIKTPPHQFEQTVAFYETTVGLKRLPQGSPDTVSFEFGDCTLHIDRVPTASHAEVWLELFARDTGEAAKLLEAGGAVRCDAVEPLPEGYAGFWVAAPNGIVHLVSET